MYGCVSSKQSDESRKIYYGWFVEEFDDLHATASRLLRVTEWRSPLLKFDRFSFAGSCSGVLWIGVCWGNLFHDYNLIDEFILQIGVQKTRKPFFMPYLSKDAVSRGIASGELIKVSESQELPANSDRTTESIPPKSGCICIPIIKKRGEKCVLNMIKLKKKEKFAVFSHSLPVSFGEPLGHNRLTQ